MKTGIQVSSFKPVLMTEAQVTYAFRQIQAMGCQYVQLQWIDRSVSISHIARCLKETGIESVSVQDFYEVIRQDPEYYIQLNHQTGGTWMCVSRIPERLKTRQGLDEFVAELQQFQQKLDAYGQKLCFHPVSGDFTAIPGMDAVGYLLEAMPEMEICLDLYHLNRNCADMPGWIRRYGERICMVHFKDSRGDTLVPAGQGQTNWSGVVEACLETGIPYAFVEQERWESDPYDCLKAAMDWLNGEMNR